MSGTLAVRRAIAEVCRRLYERGLIAGQDGNVSVRVAPAVILVTPAGMSKVDVRPADIVAITLDGEPVRRPRKRRAIAGTRGEGESYRTASSEVLLHLRTYSRRPDVCAVVHAHPPAATGFAAAGEPIPPDVLPEVVVGLGDIALVPYATPGTRALADTAERFVDRHDVLLLANHGALTMGPSLVVAHQRMESLEHAARILLAARAVGRANQLSPSQIAELKARRAQTFGVQARTGSPAREGRRGKA